MEQQSRALAGSWFTGENTDGSVGMEAVDDIRADVRPATEALVTDRHAAVGADLDRGSQAPEVRLPGAVRRVAQGAALLAPCRRSRHVRRAAEFAADFLGFAMAAQVAQERLGCLDRFCGEQRGQAAPSWVSASGCWGKNRLWQST